MTSPSSAVALGACLLLTSAACGSQTMIHGVGGGEANGGHGGAVIQGAGGATGGNTTVGGGGEEAGGGAGGLGPVGGTGGGGGAVATMVLDPATLTVFDLPIGSIRYAVAGQDLTSNTCVSLIWWGPSDGQPICAGSVKEQWPYVVVTPNAQAPCMQWDYGGNVTVDEANGCVTFDTSPPGPLSATLDVTVSVSNGPFVGTIIVDNTP